MSSIVISGDTSGSVTLQAPAIAGSTVVTLPTTSMNMGTGGGSVATNTAFGVSALASNTTASNATAVGNQALFSNTTGSQNTVVGSQAAYSNTTGDVTAFGYRAAYSGVTAVYNTAFGNQALYLNTASGNTAFGSLTLYANTTGVENVAVGGSSATSPALRVNTTGSYNTAVGAGSLASNTTATNNTAIGYKAGFALAGGDYSLFVGDNAGVAATTGRGNTFVGSSLQNGAGSAITTGGKNTLLGGYTGNQGGLDIRTSSNYIVLSDGDGNPRGIFDSSGQFLVGKVAGGISNTGFQAEANGTISCTRSGNVPLDVNRVTDDGTLVLFRQDNTAEGSISVSGTTVSYNGGHLSRWAQTTTAKDDTLVKGTVLSNLDEMNVYTDADGNPVDNEQLNKVKVSDVDGDVNVAGVFVNWSHDEDHNVDEINMAMTGDMIIRIAQGTTVARGDLLMSAGDGTAKPQGDDIVRSKTVAKVTSTHITCTYADGSYCVPCVLMAC